MFERYVLLPDGRVMGQHEVAEIAHVVGSETSITVRSWDGDGQTHDWALSMPLDLGITFAEAEEWVKAQPEFAEVEDERAEIIADILPLLTDEQAEQVPNAFPTWAAGIAYAIGDRARHGGKLYRCVQAHTSQEGWEPDKTPALWVRTAPDGEIPDWVQPTGAHDAYNTGDKVRHTEKVWESTIDANVYEPGVYGWSEVA